MLGPMLVVSKGSYLGCSVSAAADPPERASVFVLDPFIPPRALVVLQVQHRELFEHRVVMNFIVICLCTNEVTATT